MLGCCNAKTQAMEDWFNDMSDTMNGSPNGHINGHHNGHTNGHTIHDEEKQNAGGIAPGLHGDFVDPHLKAQREYESDYAKLALQGGHKGLLSMTNEAEISTTDEYNRRQKGCQNLSDYNKIAHQGGHKDLLKIEDSDSECQTTPSRTKMHSTRTCGDWYNGNNNNNQSPPKSPVKIITKPISPRSPRSPDPVTPIRDQRRSNGNCIVPGGPEEAPRFGKKRFENTSRRQEAPFATNF